MELDLTPLSVIRQHTTAFRTHWSYFVKHIDAFLIGATLVLAASVFSTPAEARGAGYFGFGPPPAYHQLLEETEASLRANGIYVGAAGTTKLSFPSAMCIGRGIGRRDVCGYRYCVSTGIGAPIEMWKLQHYGFSASGRNVCGRAITPWYGDPPVEVRNFCDDQPKHAGCERGEKENYVKLSLAESTGADRLAREAAERAKAEADAKALAQLQIDAARARRTEIVTTASARGAVAAYPEIARSLYHECRTFADEVFTTDRVEAVNVVILEDCAQGTEQLLLQAIKPAIGVAKGDLAEQLKALHAYAVASVRALDNYRQSIIEARQDRSQRMAGIDERVARIELEL